MARAKLKFNGKQLVKDGTMVLAVSGGLIAGQRFLSAEAMNLDPEGFMAKNEGWIKAGVALMLLPMVKNEILKGVLIGIATGGAVKTVGRLLGGPITLGNNRNSYQQDPAIGAGDQPTDIEDQTDAGVAGANHNGSGVMTDYAAESLDDGIPQGVGQF